MTDVSVINAVPATPAKKKLSKVALLKALKFALPVAALAAFFPETVLASTAGKDLMASGNETVKGTFGKDSSVVKWVILAEVLVGAVMYMTTKNLKFLAGFAILSVFIAVGMSVAGY
ncbi:MULTISPECIES: type IV conjugative transfer system pilin TraA [Enterobacteriaceae]|nr:MULTISPECIES: type IV conjugative transfer system pilin TraA [Enterobacteriaceae]AYU97824.1 type IV conjugative transfer system pilin TraA [Enterobacter cloacae]MCP1116295.1 type IV conjugative transfer system pilin TraA [Enterobacter bugandensis]HBH9258354.1 type IV conjugative transfer system pilin TraA [Escherichia coli]HBU6133757.1 type IV conjugative transfer system pilin TraA [Enterobacter cloacae]